MTITPLGLTRNVFLLYRPMVGRLSSSTKRLANIPRAYSAAGISSQAQQRKGHGASDQGRPEVYRDVRNEKRQLLSPPGMARVNEGDV